MKFVMISLGCMGAGMVRCLDGGQECVPYDTHEAARATISKSWGRLLQSHDAKRAALRRGTVARNAP